MESEEEIAAPASPSGLSLKSARSIGRSINLSNEKNDKIQVPGSRCGLCEQVMIDPTKLTCGHSFCCHCIGEHCDRQSEDITCPQCRKMFRMRPVPQSHNVI